MSSEPLPGQILEPPPHLEVNSEEEWEVKVVLASQMYYGKLQYHVKWLGYDEDLNWYPASDFWNCIIKIQLFHHHKPQALGPPKHLVQWLEAAENDEFLYNDPDDNLPVNDWGSHSS